MPVWIISTSVGIISTHCMNHIHKLFVGMIHTISFKLILLKSYATPNTDTLNKAPLTPKVYVGTLIFLLGCFGKF